MDLTEPTFIRSRENPLIKELHKLAADNQAYKKTGRFWVEGSHLCSAAIARGHSPEMAIFSESYWTVANSGWVLASKRRVILPDALFRSISTLESPESFGFLFNIPNTTTLRLDLPTVILDRIQDAGNVGSILRSAAAFGFHQVLGLQGTAAFWSSKVLRAGMGAHFCLSLIEGLLLEDLDCLQLPLLVTSSHQGQLIQHQKLPSPCAWVFGNEGQGVCQPLMERASIKVRIDQPGGEESLNVAAAAAICLYTSNV
jgi:RNA methyltransferase, TrmH family